MKPILKRAALPALRPARWIGASCTAAGIMILAAACGAVPPPHHAAALTLRGAPQPMATSQMDLDRIVRDASATLAKAPGRTDAAVTLADALLRQARVGGNGALALRAEQALVRTLATAPDDYAAKRSLTAVYLSQHRFHQALTTATQCLAIRTDDAWVYGVIGDAHLELGEYEEAFAAFDTMNRLKPNAASYARASYARELQGDTAAALRFMRMAAEATPARDSESLAWHAAQLGDLYLLAGDLSSAEREFARANHAFPEHPLAVDGLVRVALARGRYQDAWTRLAPRMRAATVLPGELALASDALRGLGHADEAARYDQLAEAAWRSETPEPARLSRFLTDRNRPAEALAVAEQEWQRRHDIVTADALAWAHHQLGHRTEARVFIALALRTGTRDPIIREHAARIANATSHSARNAS